MFMQFVWQAFITLKQLVRLPYRVAFLSFTSGDFCSMLARLRSLRVSPKGMPLNP
jgi:hypothetical protein